MDGYVNVATEIAESAEIFKNFSVGSVVNRRNYGVP